MNSPSKKGQNEQGRQHSKNPLEVPLQWKKDKAAEAERLRQERQIIKTVQIIKPPRQERPITVVQIVRE